MLCKCHWIVLYTVHFTAFCLGAVFSRTRRPVARGGWGGDSARASTKGLSPPPPEHGTVPSAFKLLDVLLMNEDNTTRINIDSKNTQTSSPSTFLNYRMARYICTTGSASDQQSTNDRKVAGSRPTKVVCITVLTGNRMG